MCGIAGYYSKESISETNKKKSLLMGYYLHHRGPDDEGYFIDNNIIFIHKRLSIIDLKTGHQPMFSFDKRYCIIYNGEVYNYKELKSTYLNDFIFQTSSDTEVILNMFIKMGEDCISLFNGMFAFAIWDKISKSLFIARDRLGIKPLYYFYNDDVFIFASEIKAIIFSFPEFNKGLNTEAFADYITFQNIMNNKTFFKNIYILEPASYLILKDNQLKIKRYWNTNYKIRYPNNKNEILEKFKININNAVKRHLISDVEVGCYLSGGFDSSSVATIASKYLSKPLSTFTGYFDEGKKYDERECAYAVANKIKANIYEIKITPKDFENSIYKIIYHLDEPRVGIGAFPQFYVAKLTSQFVKVILTGHGGDELFAGYPVYKVIKFREDIKKNPFSIFKNFLKFNFSEYPHLGYFLIFPLFFPNISLGLYNLFNEKEKKLFFSYDLFSEIEKYNPYEYIFDLIKNLEPLNIVSELFIKTYLHSLFIVEDKIGMSQSLEARLPLCDNDMIDFATGISFDLKLYNYQLKYIIKEAMKDELPYILYNQPKKGFPTPLSIWFKSYLKEFVKSILFDNKTKNRGLFNIENINKFLSMFFNRNTDNMYDYIYASKIWAFINIELWFRTFIDKN